MVYGQQAIAKFEKKNILFFFCRGKRYSKNVLTIDDTVITRVASTKFLGVIISKDLIWKEHTNVVSNKASK